LALESVRRRTLIIGEDLGTVAPHIRRDLKKTGVFSYRVFYFERDGRGRFRPPQDYPPKAVAAVTTHDLPTLAGYWQGEDIKLKSSLGLYPQAHLAAEETAARARDRERLLEDLGLAGAKVEDKGESGGSISSCPEEMRFGVLEYIARSKAALMEVRLEEIFGVSYQQNLPGTTTQYPNWRRKLPLTLKEMRKNPAAMRLAARLRQYRGGAGK
jgi:4-alpha-glucanotransferase